MNARHLLIWLLLSTISLSGQIITVIPANRPKRPALPIVIVKEQPCAVIAFAESDPVVMIDGDRKPRPDAKIALRSGKEFGQGLVSVEAIPAGGSSDRSLGFEVGKESAFTATMCPDRDLNNAFLLVVVYETMGNIMLTETQIAVKGIGLGRIEAGHKKTVTGAFPHLQSKETKRYTVLIYNDGVPLATSIGNEAMELFLEVNDRIGHANAMDARMKGNQKLKLFRSMPFKFGEELQNRYGGRSLQARVQVSVEGLFVKVDVPEISDPSLIESLTKQLEQWLFLPPVIDGKVHPATVVVPVKI